MASSGQTKRDKQLNTSTPVHQPDPTGVTGIRRKGFEMEKYAFVIADAVQFSGLSRTSIYEALKRGDLKARKAGRRTLILRDDLISYLHSLHEMGAK